jgi:ankyrin repeat protein
VYGINSLICHNFLLCRRAGGGPAALAALPKPEPTLVDTAFIIANAGYHDEGLQCMWLCKDTYTDTRLLEPLVHARFGQKKLSLLMSAAACNHVERASLLLTSGARDDASDMRKPSALRIACLKGHESVVGLLIERKADINPGLKYDGYLLPACASGHEPTIRLLLSHGASPKARDANAQTPLHYACIGGDTSIARMLIENGADMSALALKNAAPIHVASSLGHDKVVRLLLENRGASLQRLLDSLLRKANSSPASAASASAAAAAAAASCMR